MYLDCESAMELIIPAARVAVANVLNEKYKMPQQEIAKRLGVAQAAVSKYLNHQYSGRITKMEAIIRSSGVDKMIVRAALSDRNKIDVPKSIDRLASNNYLVKQALRLQNE